MKEVNKETNSILTKQDEEEMKNLLIQAQNNKRKRKKKDKIAVFLQFVFLLVATLLLCFSILIEKDGQTLFIIADFLMVMVALLFLFQTFANGEKSKHFFKDCSFLLLILLIGVTFFTRLQENKEILTLGDFTNQKINDVLSWAKENNIQVEQSYEYSDTVAEFDIIRQDILPATPLQEVNILKVVISLGPNYEQEIILPDLTGQNLSSLRQEMESLHLNNVLVKYQVNEEFEKDTILSQTHKGQMKRNQEVTFTLSLGSKESLLPTTMIDLTNLSKFEAILWLEQHAISYTIETSFSSVAINHVIAQDISVGEALTPFTSKVKITLSKGESIKVPNLKGMTTEEIVDWIIENNLKIEFKDRYDTTVPLGQVIEANYKEGDEVSSGTTIQIVTSKGQLKMPKFSSLAEFRTWANTYGIKYTESYEMNDKVKKGEVIQYSYQEGDIIDLNSTITVKVSSGKAITIPNFYGMDKTTISNKCNSLGLNCSFFDAGYTSLNAGLAVSQNMKANSVVTSGTYVQIGLSKGIAKTFTVNISQSTIMSCVGDSNCTINALKSIFASSYPGVNFQFLTKASSVFQFAGNIHEDSPIKDGSNVTQGKTYTVWITK